MERYNLITEKRKREIVLLRGRGCIYKKCSFCDYHLDRSDNDKENFSLNKSVLQKVTGHYGELEVINSGSVFELDNETLAFIKKVCKQKNISTIHFESHYLYQKKIPLLRKSFSDFNLKMKLGLETFDFNLRENLLNKGISECSPEIISRNFDEANLLVGITGQSLFTIQEDIRLGLAYFERLCLNVMCENSTPVKPDKNIINIFMCEIYPTIKDNERIDILVSNTDFGVGD